MEPRVRDLMRRSFIRVAPDEDVEAVRRLMTMARVRELPVVEEGDRLAGMVRQWDLARAALENARKGVAPAPGESIARFVHTVRPIPSDAALGEAARRMLGDAHSCLPAVDAAGSRRIVGLLVEGDLLRAAYR